MKQMIIACAVCVGLVTGCMKKEKGDKQTKNRHHRHTVAMRGTTAPQTVPVYAQNNGETLDDDFITNFAFAEGSEDLFGSENDGMQVANVSDVDTTAHQTSDDECVMAMGAESLDEIKFDFNKNDIRKDQAEVIKKDVMLAKQAVEEGKEVVVRGHTCQMGSASYNLALSQKRADTVKNEMVKRGVPANSIKTVGIGYESPLVASHATERAEKIRELAPNRRAEVLIHG